MARIIYLHIALDDQRPKPVEFQNFLVHYGKHWRDIGLQLGLKAAVLDVVEANNKHSQTKCFRITLQKWLQMNVGVTWGNLELAITNANCEFVLSTNDH